jgi:hypothetical protein
LDKLAAIPLWPQLPRLGFRENMYIQYATHLPGVKIDTVKKRVSVDLGNYNPEDIYTRILSDDVDSFALPKEYFSGFYELMARDIPPTVQALKGQVTGPVSLGLQMTDQSDKPVIYEEAYAEIIRKNLNLMARWQERELSKKCPKIITFIDEPYLSIIGTPFASVSAEDVRKWINEVVLGLDGLKGLHCCANTDWPLVMGMDVDLLSFDAFDYGHTISLYPEEVSRFLLIWIVFVGAVIAYIKGDHLGIDVLLTFLPRRPRQVVIIVADLLVLFALAVMLQGGWDMAIDSLESGWVASSVPIPYGWVYMVGPVSAALMLVQGVIKTVADVKAVREVWA